MLYITNYRDVNKNKWNDFVEQHPNGNIFQTPDIVHVYEKTKNYSPHVVLAIEDQEIAGVLVGVVQREYKGPVGYLSSRCIINGGPLVLNDDPGITDNLLQTFTKSIKNKAIYIQFRNIFSAEKAAHVFLKNGYIFKQHLEILIDLKQSYESLKAQIHKSRLRNYTKSLNKGVEIKKLYHFEEIREGSELIKKTYQRIRLPYPDISFFRAIVEVIIPKENCLCYGLYFQQEMIGFRMVFSCKNKIHDFYAGSSVQHSNKYPNDVLILELLKWGCSENYKSFDFGGAGKPSVRYGVRNHKLNYSHNLLDLGRFEKIHCPIVYHFAKIGFKGWQLLN